MKGQFSPTYFANSEVVNKPSNIWTTEDKRKFKLSFKVKYLMMRTFSTREYFYVFKYNTANELRDTLEMIYGDQEMNIFIQHDDTPNESEGNLKGWFSNIEYLGRYLKKSCF